MDGPQSPPTPSGGPGSPPTFPPGHEPPPLPAEALPVVLQSSLCRRCGYDLKSLPTDAVCPECATPVIRSLRGHLFEFADPEYLRGLWRGTVVIEVATIAGMTAAMLLVALIVFKSILAGVNAGGSVPGGLAWALNISQEDAQRWGQVCELATTFTVGLGLWMLTRPDPGIAGDDPDRTPRRWARGAIVASVVFKSLQTAVTLSRPLATAMGMTGTPAAGAGGNPLAMFTAPGMIGYMLIGLLVLAAVVVQYFSTMLYLRRVARRVPDPWLDEWAKRMMWLGPVLYTVGSVACGLGPLVAVGLYLMLIDRCRRRVRGVLDWVLAGGGSARPAA